MDESHAGEHSGGHSGSHSPEEVQKHVRTYWMIFGALMVLTVVTVVVGTLQMAIIPALAAALVIAFFKGSLVAAWFMHLKGERPIIAWLLVVTAFLLLFMMVIFVSAWYDQQGVRIVS